MPVMAASLLLEVVVGCASPGPPRPPSLNIPATVNDLTAARVGDDVVLRWTAPEKTTDKFPIKGTATVVVCREVTPPLFTKLPGEAACAEVERLTMHEGAMQTVDHLPQRLTSEPVRLLSYRVTVANAAGRSGAASAPAFAAAGVAPQKVVGLQVKAVKGGTLVEWQRIAAADAGADVVELTRVDQELAARDAAQAASVKTAPAPAKTAAATGKKAPAPKKGSPQPAPKTSGMSFSGTNDVEPAEVQLRAGGMDGGGTVDRTAANGQTYVYTAERVRSVKVAGHELRLQSAVSAPVTIAVRDVFPPAVPSGLAAVPNSTPGEANAGQAASIDLSWEPVADEDLAGYVVYRRDLSVASAAVIRLTAAPIEETAYRDMTAVPGVRYAYTVTAIDTSGNESKASAAAEETLRK